VTVGCTNALYSDDFAPAGAPCGGGFPGGNATGSCFTRDGALTMAPQLGDGNDCSCTTPSFSFSNGIFVEVQQILGSGGTFTILQIDTPSVAINVNHDGGPVLHMDEAGQRLSQATYNAETMRWWRLRPEGGNVVGEYSKDGKAWVALATTSAAAPASVQASINAGTYGTSTPMTATFDNLGTCPP
jgi:hypothetical protein